MSLKFHVFYSNSFHRKIYKKTGWQEPTINLNAPEIEKYA